MSLKGFVYKCYTRKRTPKADCKRIGFVDPAEHLVRLYPNITETAQSVDGNQLSKRTGIGMEKLKEYFAALEQNKYAEITSWNCDTRLYFLEPRETIIY
ncbi:MAG: hypothetical protein CM15mP32_0870 [Flavobacteriaceae bacterium]|nr:MAG: hypothetical protein CM15mP32_0870 [Flavobacteriaceae bacterium]